MYINAMYNGVPIIASDSIEPKYDEVKIIYHKPLKRIRGIKKYNYKPTTYIKKTNPSYDTYVIDSGFGKMIAMHPIVLEKLLETGEVVSLWQKNKRL